MYQEEKITARISGRSNLIEEKEAKNYNSLYGGSAARWLPKPCPLPKVGGIAPKISSSAISHHMNGLRVTPSVREWPAKGREWLAEYPPRSHMTSVVGGEENTISLNTFQLMVISRNLFYKKGVQILAPTLFQCQSLPPPLHELWEANILLI